MTRLVYFVGEPGVGKSTLMGEILQRLPFHVMPSRKVFPLVTVHDMVSPKTGEVKAQYLGVLREKFPGTDALSMGASPRVLDYLGDTHGLELMLGEGARLGTGKFFEGLTATPWKVDIVHLHAGEGVARRRRDQRGSKQEESWVKASATRALRAAEKAEQVGHRVHRVGASEGAGKLAERVLGELEIPY